jgi:hypothetical protein
MCSVPNPTAVNYNAGIVKTFRIYKNVVNVKFLYCIVWYYVVKTYPINKNSGNIVFCMVLRCKNFLRLQKLRKYRVLYGIAL